MKPFLLTFILFSSFLYAQPIDPSLKHFALKEEKKCHVDEFDFSGSYPDLEEITIDARRKKCVEIQLTGDYPQLSTLNYEGSFGSLTGKLTGNFPLLSTINFMTLCSAIHLNLDGRWEKECTVNVQGSTEDITLTLPKKANVIVNVTKMTGKVITNDVLKKKGWGMCHQTYINPNKLDTYPQLVINVVTGTGNIIFK